MTKQISLGGVLIGGGAPVSIQSMCNTDTRDVAATLQQIRTLATAGCQIIRLAVLDSNVINSLAQIVNESPIPVVADIHFDWRLAIAAVQAGVHGLRLNPGNIGSRQRITEVIAACTDRMIPIRIGVNSGSVRRELIAQHNGNMQLAMLDSALEHIHILEDLGYHEIKVSVKSSNVREMIAVNRLLSNRCQYPIHLGLTEAGLAGTGSVKSAIALGTMLAEGIGDTLRVSLTSDPVQEVELAKQILRALDIRKDGLNLIACPTCGRTSSKQFEALVKQVETELSKLDIQCQLTVAVMGCVVNGPGEAAHADIGVSFGGIDPDSGLPVGVLMRQGQILAKLPEQELINTLITEAKSLCNARQS